MLLLPVAKSPIVVPSSEVERGYIGEHATSLSILISPSFMVCRRIWLCALVALVLAEALKM